MESNFVSGGSVLAYRMLVLTALLAAVSGCQRPPAEGSDPTQAILELERRALDQWAAGNPVGYAHVGADDITYFDDIAAQSRVEGIEAIRTYFASLKGKIPPHKYEIVNPKVQAYGDIGVLTLHYNASTMDGKPAARWKATSVYLRIGSEWRVVHAHWSLVKPAS